MRYKIKKETKPNLPTFGKYKAVAVHNQVIESRQLYEEAARHSGVSGGVLEGLMMSVAETVYRHLRMGDKVRLKEFGLFKLEIESEKVDNLKDFVPKNISEVSVFTSSLKATRAHQSSIRISLSNVSKIAQRVLNEHLQNGYDGEIIICCFTEADAKYFI